jgi:hypothetical protein
MRIVVTKASTRESNGSSRENWIGLRLPVFNIIGPNEIPIFPNGAYVIDANEISNVLKEQRPEAYQEWMLRGNIGAMAQMINKHFRTAEPVCTFIPFDCAELIEGEA